MNSFNANSTAMVEVFITDVRNQIQVERILKILEIHFPELKVNFDLDDLKYHFPCGHTILRAEGAFINSQKIISAVSNAGFMCDVLEDKVCI